MESAPASSMARRIDAVLSAPQLPRLLEIYFSDEPGSPFAGLLFDALGNNPPDRITSDDLLAVSLLDVRFGPVASRRLLSGEFDDELSRLKTSAVFWEMAVDDELYRSAIALYRRLSEVHGLGATRVSKILARKRPELVPIGDSVITRVLGVEGQPWWRPLATVLDEGRRRTLTAAAPEAGISVLRLLDVSLWMLGSRSRTAGAARVAVGLPREAWQTAPDS